MTAIRAALVAALVAVAAGCAAPDPAPEPAPAPVVEQVRLYTHCGIRDAAFAGRRWVADPRAPEPAPVAGPDGIVRVDGYTTGEMRLVAPDRARFTAPGAVVEFVPAQPGPARPPCA